MNEVLQNLYARKSVRLFSERPVQAQTRRQILEAAAQAPTAGNQQLYTIVEITDPQIRETLAQLCDQQWFIAAAPMVLVFLADVQKWYDAFVMAGCAPREPGAGDLFLAVEDACIAAQNAVTAAWSLGVGSCYIGDVMENCERVRALLDLPEYVFPAAMLVLGYPTQAQLERRKPARCPLEEIVCENRYVRKDEQALRRLLSNHGAEREIEAWLRAFCARKYDCAFSREMTRSAQVYLRAFRGGENFPG